MKKRTSTEINEKSQKTSSIGIEVQKILNAIPFYAFLIDADHKIIAANDVVSQDLGMDSGQIMGAYCPVAVHGINEPVAECPLRDAIEKGQDVERELFDDKSNRWLHAAVYPTSTVTADGKPIYLHFVRDITQEKIMASDLAQSLEHHKALCDLLQNLQYCHNSVQVLEVLIDQVLSLSWLGMATTAVGFLVKENKLEMKAHRNITPGQAERCRTLPMGECLCGKALEIGDSIFCSSDCEDHSIRLEGMGAHQHAVLPIKHKDTVQGVLTLYLNEGNEMDEFRIGFLQAAAAAAGAALAGQQAKEEVLRTQEKCMALVISSQEDERKRVAGDLHDQLCQSLSAILLQIQAEAKDVLTKSVQHSLETQIRTLIDQVSEMAGQLRPSILDDYGLESTLARKAKELSAHTELIIDFQYLPSAEPTKRFPSQVEVSLYRVAMEALDNAITHAAASRVSMIIVAQPEKAMLLVEDDGSGFDYPAIRKNMDRCAGLIGMEERIILLGGTLRIESGLQKGTTIRAEVPLNKTFWKV